MMLVFYFQILEKMNLNTVSNCIGSWHHGCFLKDGEREFADKVGGERNVTPKLKNWLRLLISWDSITSS